MRDCNQRRAAIAQAMQDLSAFAGSTLLNPFVALLDALAEDAIADLITIAPEKLQRKQGVISQLQALRGAMVNPTPDASPIAT